MIYFFIDNIYLCNYADNNTFYAIRKNLDKLKLDLQSNFLISQKWFYENQMILKPVNCHYMLLGGHAQIDYTSLNGIEIESSRNETLLGVILDDDLKLDAHIKSLRRKAAQKLSALSRINTYLPNDQKLLLLEF